MIRVDAIALQNNAKQRELEIREKELVFFLDNLNAILVSASFLGANSFAAITTNSFPPNVSLFLEVSYYAMTLLSMSLNLIATLNATICVMFGPGLALRGPENGMERAVLGLQTEKRVTFWYFKAGVTCFSLATGLHLFLWYNLYVSCSMFVIYVSFVIIFMRYDYKIQKLFEIPENFDCQFVTADAIVITPTITPVEIARQPKIHPPVPRNSLRSARSKNKDTSSSSPGTSSGSPSSYISIHLPKNQKKSSR